MNEVVTEIDGLAIAKGVAVRSKALKALRESRRPGPLQWTALLFSVVIVELGLSAFHTDLWAKLVLSVASILTFASVGELWQVRRQLSAISELLLLSEADRD
jgi:hypothetical protein